ncbi:hypothetical protein ABES38_11845 [Bacillus gobiensis]|uniref:DUF6973 domain-containing protein n=1 Tax=Bacillus gobiensis TaxID=1441095 RepID=UPI003D1ACF3E
MRKILSISLVFVLLSGLIDLNVSTATENDTLVLSDQVVNNLTEVDYAYAYERVTSGNDIKSLSEEELDRQTIIVLNEIYQEKINSKSFSTKSSSNLPISWDSLNSKEKEMAKKHPFQATIMYNCSAAAKSMSIKHFKYGDADDNNANAYRHAFWNAILSREMGTDNAKKWTDAHEYGHKSLGTEMDLKNNATGRSIYTALAEKKWLWFKPGYLEISDDILTKVKQGKLVRIVNKKIVKTDGSGRK